MDGQVYTPREVARMLKVSERTVRRWVRTGELPALRFGRQLRIPPAAVENLGQPVTGAGQTRDRAVDWLARCREVREKLPVTSNSVKLLKEIRSRRS